MTLRQQGMAVLTVLLLITLMSLLAVTSQDRFQQGLRLAESGRFALQSAWLLRGAESWLLRQPLPVTPQGVQQLQLQHSLIHYQWLDRQACFNLNALARQNTDAGTGQRAEQQAAPPHDRRKPDQPQTSPSSASRRTAAQQLFLQLLAQLNVTDEHAQQILATLTQQLQQGEYREKSQLREPPSGIGPALWQRLAPLVCTLPSRQLKININGLTGAQLPLLVAMLDGLLPPQQVAALLADRPDQGWPSWAAMLAASGKPIDDNRTTLLHSTAVTTTGAHELLLWTQEGHYSNSLRSRIINKDEQLQVTDRLYGLSE